MPTSRSASDAAWEASVNVAEEIEVAGDGTPDPDLDLDIDLDLGLDLDRLEPAGPGNAQREQHEQHEQHEQPQESQEAQGLGQQTQGGDKDSGDRDASHGPAALNGHSVAGNGNSHENDEHRGHGTFTLPVLFPSLQWRRSVCLMCLTGLLVS